MSSRSRPHPSRVLVGLSLIVAVTAAHAQPAGEATRLRPLGTDVAAPADPAAPPGTDRGSIQVGAGHASLTGDNPNWRDYFVRGNVALGERDGVVNWELSRQSHFGETGTAGAVSYTRDFNEDWYGAAGVGIGRGADFLPSHRVDLAVYRKWLDQRQLVTGLQWTGSRSGNKQYRDRALQLSATYYFPFALVAETGVKFNTSNPGDVDTRRYFASATYGRAKSYTVSARYDTGREGYLPTSAGIVDAVNFSSRVAAVSLRKWVTSNGGFEVVGEHYRNPFYRRNSISAAIFVDF